MECEENKLFICSAIRYTDVTDNGDFEIWLLSLCAELRSKDAMDLTCSVIHSKLLKSALDKRIFQRKGLEIIRTHSQRAEYFLYINTEWMLERIGQVDINYAISFFEKWIEEENNGVIYFDLATIDL